MRACRTSTALEPSSASVPGLVRQGHRRQLTVQLERQRPEVGELAATGRIARSPRTRRRQRWAVRHVRQATQLDLDAAKPASRSARMSSMPSRPTASRISPGVTPDSSCSSGVSCEWVVEAGWIPASARRRCWPRDCAARAHPRRCARPPGHPRSRTRARRRDRAERTSEPARTKARTAGLSRRPTRPRAARSATPPPAGRWQRDARSAATASRSPAQ